jgi:hypothetical protein
MNNVIQFTHWLPTIGLVANGGVYVVNWIRHSEQAHKMRQMMIEMDLSE